MRRLVEKYKSCPIQVRASFWFIICAFLQKGISMLTTPIFTRLFTTAEYGQYSVYSSWLSIVTAFVSLNLTGGVYTQGLVKFSDDKDRYSSSLQGLSTSLLVIWVVIYFLFQDFWNGILDLSSIQVTVMLFTIWTTAIFNFWANEQRVKYKYRGLVVLTSLVSIVKPVAGVIVVVNSSDKVTARILEILVVEFVFYIGLYIYQLKKGKKFFVWHYWKHALKFNIPLVPHYLSQIVLNSADRIMIAKLVGDSQAGIYSLAYSVSSIMTLFNTALMQTISPWIYKKIKNKRISDIEPIAYITLLFIAGVNILLILFAPEAVYFFAPNSYYEAIWIIPPVALSSYFMCSYDLFAKFAFYYEKTTVVMIASTIGAVLNIILNYLFIGLYGYRAAGYTTLVCYIVYSVAHYIFMNAVCKKYCNGIKPYSTKKILLITIPFVVIGLLLLLTYNNTVIRYVIIILVAFLIFTFRKKILFEINRLLKLKKTNDNR